MLTQDQIDAFHRDGLLVLPGLLDATEVDALRTDVDATVATGVAGEGAGHRYRPVDGRRQYFRTDGVWGYGKTYRDVTVKAEILAVVGQLLGHPFLPINDSIVVKLPHSGVPIEWHQDHPYSAPQGRATTFGVPNFDIDIYLDHATLDNGCLYAIAGHHLVGHVDVDRFTEDELFERHDAVPLEMAPGDVLVHSITAPHGSRANDSDDIRRVVYFHYMAREVLEALHPDWSKTKPAFSAEGLGRAASMVNDAETGEGLALRNVELGNAGFEFTGSPATPPYHWQSLIDHIPPEEVAARRVLST